MNPYARPQAYREASVMTASPEQLVVMLYDGAGRFLRQAEGTMNGGGSWLQASQKLSRAEAIIDELLATLDMDAGEIAERLQAIYVFCKTRLIEARLERDPGRVDQVARLLAELRDAWATIEPPAVA
jgi:flagellar protein FliS